MVFPSLPVYLDPPNWQQQFPNQQGQVASGHENPQLPPLPPPPPPHVTGGPTSSGSIRPGSMADRARLAKIPQPEPGLKCPRCESTNTKFCYFNNYSLTQPRHFCKTCRRYWTRGGALRNVPVGGGCRRNKKSKSNQSSSSCSSKASASISSDGSGSITSTSPILSNIMTHNLPQHHPTQLPFKTSLNNVTQFGVGNLGLNFSGIGISGQTDIGLMSNAILSTGGSQHVPFFDPPQALFPFHHQSGGAIEGSSSNTNSRVSDQVAPVKMEESRGLNLSRQLLGVSESSQYWPGGGYTWSDLSGIDSSSTSHLL